MKNPPYVNRLHLQGRVVSKPVIKSLNARTSLTAFQLSMVESWLNGDGTHRERRNRVNVEVVGKDSAEVAAKAKIGSWVTLEGYIRSEQFQGRDLTKVRTLAVNVWEAND